MNLRFHALLRQRDALLFGPNGGDRPKVDWVKVGELDREIRDEARNIIAAANQETA